MDVADNRTERFSGWYSDPNSCYSAQEILSNTFVHAKQLLRATVKPADFESLFPPTGNGGGSNTHAHVATNTIFDVQRCVKDAQAAYECRTGRTTDPFDAIAPSTLAFPSTTIRTMPALSKSKAKARAWLTGLSEKLLHYGNIFDVMVQQNPEYVSLAWGTFKLLFMAITNHAETISKLSKSISMIADLLPQQQLHLILYPTPQMQTCVARLYGHIMEFLLSSLKWYRESRAAHAVKAILQPWDLKFRPQYDAIESEARQIARLADLALKAEVRDTRLEVVRGNAHWQLVQEQMDQLKVENQRLAALFEMKFGIMADSMNVMYKEIRLDLTAQRGTLSRVHLNQMLSLPFWNALPPSGEALRFCRSMRARRRELRQPLSLPDVKKLEAWSSERDNVVLLIDTYMPSIAKTIMVDLIDLILQNKLSIIWALRYAGYQDTRMSSTDVIRMLVLQAMQLGADNCLGSPFPVTVEQLQGAASLHDWINILNRVLSGVGPTFIVLDADLLAYATAYERSEALEILDLLRLKLSSSVKIVVARSSIGQGYSEELMRSNVCIKIQSEGAANWRKPRRPRRPMVRFQK